MKQGENEYASCDGSSKAGGRTDLAAGLKTHTYPKLLHASRTAYRLFQLAVHATTLRSWYVRRAIRRSVRQIHSRSAADSGRVDAKTSLPVVVLDVGCGSGDHLHYALRRLQNSGVKAARGIGLDRAGDAIALCRSHARGHTVEFAEVDLNEDSDLPRAELILCITVLQYIRKDAELLHRLRRALRKGGVLLLYVPVRNERLLPLYNRIVQGSGSDYDAAQEHHRVYEPSQVKALVEDAGFHIDRTEHAYGVFGKLAFEIHSILLGGLTHSRAVVRGASALAAGVLAPVILIMMGCDFVARVSPRGNAILIEAR